MTSLTVFWGAALLLAYAYAGYPLLLALCSRLFGKAPVPPASPGDELPRVSVLVVARDEEEVIAARLANLLALDYPADRLEIVIASDGSSDRTDDIVRCREIQGVRLEAWPEPCGKAAALNRVLPRLSGDIVVLSDANTLFAPDNLRKLVRWFADPAVGVVCGRLHLVDRKTGANVDGLYWRFETALKEREARLNALVGANGANYALRRELFTPIPDRTILDDFVLPLRMRLGSGCRLVFDREAVAAEETAPNIHTEFRRRARIGTGGFQAIGFLWRLLNPKHGWIAFTFLCHKVLRWLCPFFLLALLASNLALAAEPFFRATLAAQVLFHVLAAILPRLRVHARLPRPLRLAVMFQAMNLALLAGFWHWLWEKPSGAWRHSARAYPLLLESDDPTKP